MGVVRHQLAIHGDLCVERRKSARRQYKIGVDQAERTFERTAHKRVKSCSLDLRRPLRFEYEQLEDLNQEAHILPGKPGRNADCVSSSQE